VCFLLIQELSTRRSSAVWNSPYAARALRISQEDTHMKAAVILTTVAVALFPLTPAPAQVYDVCIKPPCAEENRPQQQAPVRREQLRPPPQDVAPQSPPQGVERRPAQGPAAVPPPQLPGQAGVPGIGREIVVDTPPGPQVPANVAERALQRKLGSDFNEISQRIQQQQLQLRNSTGQGVGAPSADRYFDQQTRSGQVRPTTGQAGNESWRGTQFFQPVVTPVDKPTTRQNVDRILNDPKWGTPSIGGGVMLEGVASGLGPISKLQYHAGLNALMLDNRAAYFFPVPPRAVAVLCRAIQKDDRVGVSLGKVHIVYGQVPPDSDVATDLKLADHFLGDIVWAGKDWTAGYRFANGFEPERHQGPAFPGLVHFNFGNFQFQIVEEEFRSTKVDFSAQLIPVSTNQASDGGMLPDFDAIDQGRRSVQYEHNKKHLVENIGYYRKEKIVERAFEYGEVAAFLRGLKDEGIDLTSLAGTIESAVGAPPSPAAADGDPNVRMERAWAEYLGQIQKHNYHANWSERPYDLYMKRLADAPTRDVRSFRVVGVASNDVLYIRSGPAVDHPILGRIPPNGRGVRIVSGCTGQWCQVEYRGVPGWANRQFLELEQNQDSTTYRVVRVADNDALNIRLGPGARHPIVDIIPWDGKGVRLVSAVECVGVWCEVDYRNKQGWVNTLFLAPEQARNASTYKVVNVATGDALNIRAEPAANSRIVERIPPDGRGVRMVGDCSGQWCQIDYRGARGWVNSQFLAAE
jgi:uncharacterized protein YraI